MKRLYKIKWLLVLLAFTFLFRIVRLSQPAAYIFDEVYHVPSIRAISQNNPDAYDVYAKAPEPNTAYDWLHPPLAKLIQAGSVKILGDNNFAWRFPSAIFGTFSVAALYFLSLTLTKNPGLSLLAASFFSFDNLQLTMSRIAMNDIFVTTWILLALTFFSRSIKGRSFANAKVRPYWNLILTGIFTGLALATKHSAILLYPIFFIFILRSVLCERESRTLLKLFRWLFSLFLLPLGIYFLSYSQMFFQGSSLTDFFNLHKQIYWYQTNLKATHSYQTTAWQWPLLIRPVWFYSASTAVKAINIYNLGNPLIFWAGLIALIYQFIKGPSFANAKVGPYWIIYLLLFAPFVLSPRIMFLHHYLPALPILCLILAKAVWPYRRFKFYLLGLTILLFFFFYPLNTAIPLPQEWLKFWFWLPTWR